MALSALGLVTLCLSVLVRAPVLVAPAAAALGAAYAVARAIDGGAPDLQAPLVGVALLITCELAYWAHELRMTAPDEPGARARRLAWLATLGVVSLLPGVALLGLADLVRIEGIAVEAVGTLSAAALVLGLVLVARGSR